MPEMSAVKKLREIWRRLGFYFRRERFDRELDDEMRFHLAMKACAKMHDGVPSCDAQFDARRQFGNEIRLKERSREMWSFRWIDTTVKDLQYSLRMIRKSPVFASVVILSLALAIGANTAIFSLVNAVLLKTLPVKNPQELVLFGSVAGRDTYVPGHSGMGRRDTKTGLRYRSSLSTQMFQRMKQQNQTLTDLFAYATVYHSLNVSVDNSAGIASGQYVSGGYYKGLGVQPVIGRMITDEDDKIGASPVAVITYRYWVERFGRDAAIVGKPAFINAEPFTIIGVSQPGFECALGIDKTADVSIPLVAESIVNRRTITDSTEVWNWWLRIMGRLKPGVTIEQARVNMEPIVQQSPREEVAANLAQHPNPQVGKYVPPTLTAISGSQGDMFVRQEYAKELYILLIIVGIVLVIASVNVANLMLSRSGARQKEIAIRIALGAGRLRLIRQLLTESMTLAIAGGLTGLVFAYWIKGFLIPMSPWGDQTLKIDMNLDFRVLVFTAGASILTGIMFGIAPALKATRIDPGPSLKESAGSQGGGRSRFSLGRGLVVVQVALSIMLLVGAGLFVRTLQNLQNVDYGFDAQNVLLFEINPSLNGYKSDNLQNIYQQVADRIDAVPGVKSTTVSLFPLMTGGGWGPGIPRIPGAKKVPDQNASVYLLPVMNNFFETMRIPLLTGRGFDSRDSGNSQKVAIVNEAFVKMAFDDGTGVGEQIEFPRTDSVRSLQVIGIAKDSIYEDLRSAPQPIIYLPFQQQISSIDRMASGLTYEVKSTSDPTALVPAIREIVRSIDSKIPILNIRSQQAQIEMKLDRERGFATMTAALGLLVLILAGLGLYGVMSYNVTRRTREIGIRMALGAGSRRVLAQVMQETIVVVSIGIVIGIVASIEANRLMAGALVGFFNDQGMLFGVSTRDPISIAAAAFFLLAVASLAGYLPARKAANVNPLVALRYE